MCSEPAMRAPFSGFLPYSSRSHQAGHFNLGHLAY
jgi:hypothetical protein